MSITDKYSVSISISIIDFPYVTIAWLIISIGIIEKTPYNDNIL